MNPLVARAVGKSARKLIPFLIVLYLFAVLDRANVGFAALSMNAALGLTAQTFGFGATMFLIGYVLFEVPSNLAMARVGGRRWLARIAVTWGIATALVALSTGPLSFYALRFLVGAAEAGCLPGIFYFLTQWFPQSTRGRYNAIFILAIPLANAVSGPLSAALLDMHGLAGLAGWQWLFLAEGAVSSALGIVCFFFLKDGPAEATWLSVDERHALVTTIASERHARESVRHYSVLQALSNPIVIALAFAYMGINVQLNSAAFWFPQVFRSFGLSTMQVGFATATPFLFGAGAMILWGRRSDKANERVLHVVAAVMLSAVGWAAAGLSGSTIEIVIALSVAAIGFFSATAVFWTLPSGILAGPAAAAAIALISAMGNLGSAVAAPIIGSLRDAALKQGGGWTAPLMFVAALTLIAPAILLVLRKRLEALKVPDTARAASIPEELIP